MSSRSRMLELLISSAPAFQKKYICGAAPTMVGHRADTIICDDVQSELVKIDEDQWGESSISRAIPWMTDLNHLYGKRYGKTMTGLAHYLVSHPEEDMDTKTNQMHCHLCFAPRTFIHKSEEVSKTAHTRQATMTFECGTQIFELRHEEKVDGVWQEEPVQHTVKKGSDCIK